MSASKITGEEDRYSHTDLSDFAANLDGAKAAFDRRRSRCSPATTPRCRPASTQNFAAVLGRRSTPTRTRRRSANGYVIYTTLDPEQTPALSTTVDALAEPLSKVAAQVLT